MKLRFKKKQNHMVNFTIQIFSVVMYRQYGNVAFFAIPEDKSCAERKMLWNAQLVCHLCSPSGLTDGGGGILMIKLGKGLYVFFKVLPNHILDNCNEWNVNKKQNCNSYKFLFWVVKEDPNKTLIKLLICDQESLSVKKLHKYT